MCQTGISKHSGEGVDEVCKAPSRVTIQPSHSSGACCLLYHVSPECSWWHLSCQINSPSTQLNPCGPQGLYWQNLTGFLIDFLYQVDEYIHRILLCYVDKLLRSMHIHRCFSLYGGVFRNKVSLTGMVEVNSLTSAGMVLTSSDSWEASSYIMGSDFRDLGNIKTIF